MPMAMNHRRFVPPHRALRPEGLHHSRGVAGSGLRPLSNIPYCCLPLESGPCLSPSVADHPLRPAMDRRLGRPLPHQQANPTRAHLKAINLWSEDIIRYLHPFRGVIPNLKAGSHALRTRAPLDPKVSFDLHVLGMPPAFVLSQDQTLKFVSHPKQARSEDRRPARHELQGADPCTVKRNGYECTCIITTRTWS